MDSPFTEIIVNRMTEGATNIFWDVSSRFNDPGPYRFRVQYGSTGSPYADDWADIGPPAIDTLFQTDNTKRDFARNINAHYRVIMETGLGRYISGPVSAVQWFDRHQWRVARDMYRRHAKKLNRSPYKREGYILFRRRFGPDCPRCLTPDTGEVTDQNCPVCFGTGKKGGYFSPLPYQFCLITPRALLERVEPGEATKGDDIRVAEFLGYPLLSTYDVFVDMHSDERFVLHTIKQVEAIGAMPILQSIEVGVLDFGNVIYQFPLPIRVGP